MLSFIAHKQKRFSRSLLLLLALCQLLLPLSSTAAMTTASADSPYYCGQMSSPLVKQILALNLPAELLEQVLPPLNLDCDACALALADSSLLTSAQQVALAAMASQAYTAPATGDIAPVYARHYSARAPPQ